MSGGRDFKALSSFGCVESYSCNYAARRQMSGLFKFYSEFEAPLHFVPKERKAYKGNI